jgi:hypothetical protein
LESNTLKALFLNTDYQQQEDSGLGERRFQGGLLLVWEGEKK